MAFENAKTRKDNILDDDWGQEILLILMTLLVGGPKTLNKNV